MTSCNLHLQPKPERFGMPYAKPQRSWKKKKRITTRSANLTWNTSLKKSEKIYSPAGVCNLAVSKFVMMHIAIILIDQHQILKDKIPIENINAYIVDGWRFQNGERERDIEETSLHGFLINKQSNSFASVDVSLC